MLQRVITNNKPIHNDENKCHLEFMVKPKYPVASTKYFVFLDKTCSLYHNEIDPSIYSC